MRWAPRAELLRKQRRTLLIRLPACLCRAERRGAEALVVLVIRYNRGNVQNIWLYLYLQSHDRNTGDLNELSLPLGFCLNVFADTQEGRPSDDGKPWGQPPSLSGYSPGSLAKPRPEGARRGRLSV